MQPFLVAKNTDLIFDLQNDCIINSNLLGCATLVHKLSSLC